MAGARPAGTAGECVGRARAAAPRAAVRRPGRGRAAFRTPGRPPAPAAGPGPPGPPAARLPHTCSVRQQKGRTGPGQSIGHMPGCHLNE
ncbi:hypothetical protein ATKI12_0945 [Kitasatospora sp. Ki12]